MENRWNPEEARAFSDSALSLRIYSSRLLGQDDDLVLHGGGNTSVKSTLQNIFGESEDVLYVKGSGWDLKTIEVAGYSPARLDYLRRLAKLDSMSDTEMMGQLRLSLLDPSAPTPSVEAILHAIIPGQYVDHTHTDAVVSISNTPDGEAILKSLYGNKVLILPYIMPGFVLARQVFQASQEINWTRLKGIFFMHHGLFTFADDAKESYDNMIELVNLAEHYLEQKGIINNSATGQYQTQKIDYETLAQLRQKVSELAQRPMLASWQQDEYAVGFSGLDNVADIAVRGPVTPDHSIHTKISAAILDHDPLADIDRFQKAYLAYFERNNITDLNCLDPAPRVAVWKNKGMLSFANNARRLNIVTDISRHTTRAIQWGEALGGWQALPETDLFAVEYWELEQAKLKIVVSTSEFEGKVVLISGAASGIGEACVEEFVEQGSCVIALDIKDIISTKFDSPQLLGLQCDVTDSSAIMDAIQKGITRFGGIDALVSNAGSFPVSQTLAEITDSVWEKCLELNLSAHMKLMRAAIPFLEVGIDPAIVFIASKNVPAPGPGAGAYSTAKAGLTQMARVAALELGKKGIRVNVLHPNAVFDTEVWTDEILQQRADHYNMSVDEYKQNNVLGVEVSSRDVARLARNLASSEFAKTTGSQIAVDGGNERVI